MTRKVFLSCLGTGKYSVCNYSREEFQFETRFIQEATLEYITQKEGITAWHDNGVAIILLTEKARESNWVDREVDGVKDLGLSSVISRFGIDVQEVDVPDGKDEEEIWKIFDIVYNELKDGDELYLDLTHSFRFFPMLMFALADLCKSLKKLSINSITYGNWEASERGKYPAPIVDLTAMSVLQDWTEAASQYVKAGNIGPLASLAVKKIRPILRDTGGKDTYAKYVEKVIGQLSLLHSQILLNRGCDLMEASPMHNIIEAQKTLNNAQPTSGPMPQLLNCVLASISDFGVNKGLENVVAAAKWCIEKEHYQQAVTLIQESVISYLCQSNDLSLNDRIHRGMVSASLNCAYNRRVEHKPSPVTGHSEADMLKIESIIDTLTDNEFLHAFHAISEKRNDLNHSGFTKKASPKKLKENIDKWFVILENYVSRGVALPVDPQGQNLRPNMFLNITNHPSSTWSDAQKSAASQWGEIVDIPFPAVSPELDEDGISALTDALCEKVYQCPCESTVVHIMGEMTLCFAAIQRLKEAGYKCIASTRDRSGVEYLPDGTKVDKFDFARFREY